MAHSRSARKRVRTNERNHQRNMAVKSRVRTYIKKALSALEAKDAEAVKTAVPEALAQIDRAATKGVLHKNSAARKKSMLQRRFAQL